MTPLGTEPTTFRPVARCLNQLRQVLCQFSNHYSTYNIVSCSSKRFCCKLQSFRGGIVLVYIYIYVCVCVCVCVCLCVMEHCKHRS